MYSLSSSTNTHRTDKCWCSFCTSFLFFFCCHHHRFFFFHFIQMNKIPDALSGKKWRLNAMNKCMMDFVHMWMCHTDHNPLKLPFYTWIFSPCAKFFGRNDLTYFNFCYSLSRTNKCVCVLDKNVHCTLTLWLLLSIVDSEIVCETKNECEKSEKNKRIRFDHNFHHALQLWNHLWISCRIALQYRQQFFFLFFEMNKL